MSVKFKKKKEDFICLNCGNRVTGSGYTNHCPECLWSRHVDNYPGDREAICKGMMEPISIEANRRSFIIKHKCVKCGLIKKNKAVENDNLQDFLSVTREQW